MLMEYMSSLCNLSNEFLNILTESALATCVGNLFQTFMTLSVKNFLKNSCSQLIFYIFSPLEHVLLVDISNKSQVVTGSYILLHTL